MNIFDKAIVSNTEMIKNYKICREKADSLNKVFILKNNQPDAVLFSIKKYEKLSVFIEYLDELNEEEINKLINAVSKGGICERDSVNQLIEEIKKDEELMADKLERVADEVHEINAAVQKGCSLIGG